VTEEDDGVAEGAEGEGDTEIGEEAAAGVEAAVAACIVMNFCKGISKKSIGNTYLELFHQVWSQGNSFNLWQFGLLSYLQFIRSCRF
jgi:hypothetical protein